MARAHKVISRVLLGFLLLALGLGVTLWALVDTGLWQQQLIEQIRERTGRTLSFGGDLRLMFFPALGVEATDVSLSNAPGFGERPMLQVGRLAVEVQVLPLLRGELRVDTVMLEELRLRLARNRQGLGNWQDLVRPSSAGKRKSAPATGPARRATLPVLALAGIRVRDAVIDWADAREGTAFHLGPLDLDVGQIRPGQPFPLEARIALASHTPAIWGRVSLKSRITFVPEGPVLHITALAVEPDLQGKALSGARVHGQLTSPDVKIDLATNRLDSPRLQWQDAGFDLALTNLTVTGLRTDPAWRAKLVVPAFDLRQYLSHLNITLPPMADDSTLHSLALDAGITGTRQRLAIDPLRLTIDDSTLRGSLRLPRLAPVAIRYDLRLDEIDADRYLPPPERHPATVRSSPPASPDAARAGGGHGLPLAALRRLDVEGRLRVDRLKAMNLHSQAIRVPLRARAGRIRLAPLSARLYQGTYAGDIRLDVTGPDPHIQLDEHLEQVQIGPLLRDLLGKDKLQGTANLAATLSADALDPVRFRRTLNGKAHFDFRDGVITGFDLPRIERELHARLKGQPLPAATGPSQTGFSRIRGTATIRNGLARNDDLRADFPHARAVGKGQADLVGETVDYTLWVKFTSEVEGQAGTPYEKLDKPALPVHITGPFGDPAIRPDFKAVLKELARRELKKREREMKNRARQELEKKARELFKGLKLP